MAGGITCPKQASSPLKCQSQVLKGIQVPISLLMEGSQVPNFHLNLWVGQVQASDLYYLLH